MTWPCITGKAGTHVSCRQAWPTTRGVGQPRRAHALAPMTSHGGMGPASPCDAQEGGSGYRYRVARRCRGAGGPARLAAHPGGHAASARLWVAFADQWPPQSPWHDQRVRVAANSALDRQALNEAACLGSCTPRGVVMPRGLDVALPVAQLPYDPAKAKQWLVVCCAERP